MSFTLLDALEVMLSSGPWFFGPCAPIDLPSSISIAGRSHLLSRTVHTRADTGCCRGWRGVVGLWDGAGPYVWVGVSQRPRSVVLKDQLQRRIVGGWRNEVEVGIGFLGLLKEHGGSTSIVR